MRKFAVYALILVSSFIIISAAFADLHIDSAFPDPNFASYVKGFDRHYFDEDGHERWDGSGNGFLDGAELNVLAGQSVLELHNIFSLKGIEYFPNIDYLKIYYGSLSELNTGANPKLTSIYCEWLKLSKINLQKNSALTDLGLFNSEITEIDLSSNTSLKNLMLGSNKISELNLSSNHNLETLKCEYNKLSVLDLSNHQKLRELKCDNNKLVSLDINSSNLDWIDCYDNKLEHLDLSSCTSLTALNCSDNNLTELDLSKNHKLNFIDAKYQVSNKLKVNAVTNGFEVCLKDYVSKLEYIDINSLKAYRGKGSRVNLISHDIDTGILLFSSRPDELEYKYNTHSPNNYIMSVTIKSPLGVEAIERGYFGGSDYDYIIGDMDAENYLDSNGNKITEDIIALKPYSTYGKIGFTADGNSRLILRVYTNRPGNVFFEIPDNIGATLENLNKIELNTLTPVHTTEIDNSDMKGHQASAVLIAPAAFPAHKNFPKDYFTVNVKFTADETDEEIPENEKELEREIELEIHAAPVLLIPGMFSNAIQTFGIYGKNGVWPELIKAKFDENHISVWNYDGRQSTNDILANDNNELFNTILEMINYYNQGGIVSTKVDIIAHGMGGLMARKFLSEENNDSRDGNNWSIRSYRRGMVRRLITVATPHRGTPWADYDNTNTFITAMYNSILNNNNNVFNNQLDNLRKPVALLMMFAAYKIDPETVKDYYKNAWLELKTTAKRNYGFPSGVPMYAIYGDIRGDGYYDTAWQIFDIIMDWSIGFNVDIRNLPQFAVSTAGKIYKNVGGKVLSVLGYILQLPTWFRDLTNIYATLLFGTEANDLIVSASSAAGDFTGHSSLYWNGIEALHPDFADRYAHWNICRQNDVGREIALLLKGSSSKFKIFDSNTVNTSFKSVNNSPSLSVSALNVNKNIDIDFKFIESMRLKVEPSVFSQSDINSKTVTLTLNSDNPVKNDVFCIFGNDDENRFFTFPALNDNRTEFKVEFNAKDFFKSFDKGTIEIFCLSFISKDADMSGVRISNTVNAALLDDLSNINIVKLDFNAGSTLYTNKNSETPAELYAIDENGNYYDISSPLNGTEWTSENESIARINQNGCVQALEEGSTTLTAKFKNFTASINITVGPAIVYDDDNDSDLQIITESLDKAFTGKIYNFTLKASESNNIKWSHTGELPPGFDLSESGIISGTPTKSGTYKFTVTASNGTDLASKEFTMIVSASGSSLEITTTTLKNGTDGKKYSVSLKAKGAKSLTWQAANLPDGLAINESTGKISGNPTQYGDFNVIITASNGSNLTQKTFSLVINPVLPKFSGKLPAGNVYKEYRSSPLKISKGSEPITWSIKESLPPGLSFDVNTGIISGTPTQGFNGKITIIAANAAGESANKLTLKITAEKPAITSINNYGLKSAIIGENYIISCAGTGTPPLSWDFTGFPEGMSYDVKTGILSGIINKSGKFKININLSNSSGKIAKKKFSLQVYNPPVITSDSLPEATYKAKYNANITATGDKTIKWRADNLPSGLKFSSKGKISGTPTAAPGEYNIIITAYNDKIPAEYSRRETSQNFTLIINNNSDPKKAYITPQNSNLANNDVSDSDSSSKLESEIINEPGEVISSNENLFIGSERDINSININISDDYIIAAVLPEIHVNKSGLYELEIELDENAQTNAKLFWLACPQNNNPSEDDEIAEFYNESGQEIFTVPENKLIIVSAWLNKDIIYAPVILVSK
ncbi:MAG: putative Ig domain-containing protein [Synergistaceae bacterium]|nr:putative Ig domain-containing protein [Synergistaceae bacterium]